MLRRSPPPDPDPAGIHRIMVASEGRKIDHRVRVRAMELARPNNASIFVMSIARVWGTGLGFPNPGLLPSKREWDEQRLLVRDAVATFEKAGFEANGLVLATRRARKRILAEARARKMDVIVMGADPHRRVIGDFMWSQEAHRVARRSKRIPVVLVPL
jgi:nucleotide-binding universal stress UspA family protein